MQESNGLETNTGRGDDGMLPGSPDPVPGTKTISDWALAGDGVTDITTPKAARVIPNLVLGRIRDSIQTLSLGWIQERATSKNCAKWNSDKESKAKIVFACIVPKSDTSVKFSALIRSEENWKI